MKLNSKQLKGLTLVELLVVLGIIVALSAVALVVIDPGKQRGRARDGVLRNSIASIGQSLDSFYGLKGYYPTPAQMSEITPFISSGFTVTSNFSSIIFVNPAVVTGEAADDNIFYYVNDFATGDAIYDLPCIEARSNEDPTRFIAWAPGFSVQSIAASCATSSGFQELTGIDVTP